MNDLLFGLVLVIQTALTVFGWSVFDRVKTEKEAQTLDHFLDGVFTILVIKKDRGFIHFVVLDLPRLMFGLAVVFLVFWGGGEFIMVYGLWKRHQRNAQLTSV